MSTFVYSRDIHQVMNSIETTPSLPAHYERVAAGVDMLAPVGTEESYSLEAFVATAFSNTFYLRVQRDLGMVDHEPTNRRLGSKKWRFYNDSHGPRGRKPMKPRHLTGCNHRVLH